MCWSAGSLQGRAYYAAAAQAACSSRVRSSWSRSPAAGRHLDLQQKINYAIWHRVASRVHASETREKPYQDMIPTSTNERTYGPPALDVFSLRDSVVDEYRQFATSFTT